MEQWVKQAKPQDANEYWTLLAHSSFSQFQGYGFLSVISLELIGCDKNIIEFMKPDNFPVLEFLFLCHSNIVTLQESISRCPRLELLDIDNCKRLREIPRLPQSLGMVDARNCIGLDPKTSSTLTLRLYLFLVFNFLCFGSISYPQIFKFCLFDSKCIS